MSNITVKEAFDSLCAALPEGVYAVRSNYRHAGKVQLFRSKARPKVVLVWKANAIENELTTRTEYAKELESWFTGLTKEASKPQYSRTFAVSEADLVKMVEKHKTKIAEAILRIDANR